MTSKIGIYSLRWEFQSQASFFLRNAIGKTFSRIPKPTIYFGLARAKKSLDASLRWLGREKTELYLLHEPELHMLNTEGWLTWLNQCIKNGKVGNFSLTLEKERLTLFLEKNTNLCDFIQMQDCLKYKDADVLVNFNQPFQITYEYLSQAKNTCPDLSAGETLKLALNKNKNKNGAIIVSKTKTERLGQYLKILEHAF